MSKIFIHILFMMMPALAFAQLDKSLAIKVPPKVPLCFQITYEAQKGIPQLYADGKADSVASLLEYWESTCGAVQEARHLRILLELKGDSFSVDNKAWLLNTLVAYNQEIGYSESNVSGYRDYYLKEWQQVETDYNAFIRTLAREILNSRTITDPLQDDILNYYAGNETPLFKSLRKEKHEGTPLQAEFDEKVNSYRYNSGGIFAFYGGTWTPTNNLSKLGTHPDLGAKLGFYENRFTFDLGLGLRFVSAPREYRVLKNDSIYKSDQYTGFYVGAGMGYALYRGIRSQFDVTAGLAYDQITMYVSDQETGEGGLTIRSINVKAGVEYKYFYNIKNYVALGAGYNFLNYKNNINDDLYGGAVTVHLIWGFTGDNDKRRELKELGY